MGLKPDFDKKRAMEILFVALLPVIIQSNGISVTNVLLAL